MFPCCPNSHDFGHLRDKLTLPCCQIVGMVKGVCEKQGFFGHIFYWANYAVGREVRQAFEHSMPFLMSPSSPTLISTAYVPKQPAPPLCPISYLQVTKSNLQQVSPRPHGENPQEVIPGSCSSVLELFLSFEALQSPSLDIFWKTLDRSLASKVKFWGIAWGTDFLFVLFVSRTSF